MSLLSNVLQSGSNSYRAQMPNTMFNTSSPSPQESNLLSDVGGLVGIVSSIASLF